MKKSIIPLLAVLFFGCSNDFSDSSIDVLRPEKEDSVERVDKSWVLIFSDEFNIDGPLTPRSGIILPGEMLLMPIIISRMIHPLFGVKMVC